jgi:hypothetical protein
MPFALTGSTWMNLQGAASRDCMVLQQIALINLIIGVYTRKRAIVDFKGRAI